MTKPQQICVVGGGMSGIAAAHYLLQQGHRVLLLERGPALGGRAGVERLGDKMVAMGGKNVGSQATLFRQFVQDHGQTRFESFGFNWMREVDGELMPVKQETLLGALRSSMKIGLFDFVRFGRLYGLVKRAGGRNDHLGNAEFAKLSDKYDSKPAAAYFGPRFNEHFLRLLTVRMNGAEPDDYFLGNLCSNLAMVRLASKGLDQLAGNGLQEVLDAFEARAGLEVRKNCTVEAVSANADGTVRVTASEGDRATVLDVAGLVMALPAGLAGRLLEQVAPGIEQSLRPISYNPVGLAVVKYRHNVFGDAIKGVSFKPSDVLHNAAAYGLHDLDTVRYTFSGKAAREQIDAATDSLSLIAQAEALLRRHCPVSQEQRVAHVYRYYPEGLCAYAPYHHRVMEDARRSLTGLNIELTGDYVKGASLEACFAASQHAARRLQERLGSIRSP